MQLVEQLRDGAHFVRRCAADHIVVVNRELRSSFIVAADRIVDCWAVQAAAALQATDAAAVLEFNPEVVLLGSGPTQVFPPAAFLAQFLTRRIGIEVMDNGAAARTFNVLVGEGRQVVAAFILPGQMLRARAKIT